MTYPNVQFKMLTFAGHVIIPIQNKKRKILYHICVFQTPQLPSIPTRSINVFPAQAHSF